MVWGNVNICLGGPLRPPVPRDQVGRKQQQQLTMLLTSAARSVNRSLLAAVRKRCRKHKPNKLNRVDEGRCSPGLDKEIPLP